MTNPEVPLTQLHLPLTFVGVAMTFENLMKTMGPHLRQDNAQTHSRSSIFRGAVDS